MEIPKDQEERFAQAKEWILKRGEFPPADLVGRADRVKTKIMAEIDGLSADQLSFSPGEGQWSIKEVCLHTSKAVLSVAQTMDHLAEGNPPAQLSDRQMGQMDEEPDSFDGLKQLLEDAFATNATSTANLEKRADLAGTAPHPIFGQLNCRQWAAFNIMHANVHADQIKRVKTSDGYPR